MKLTIRLVGLLAFTVGAVGLLESRRDSSSGGRGQSARGSSFRGDSGRRTTGSGYSLRGGHNEGYRTRSDNQYRSTRRAIPNNKTEYGTLNTRTRQVDGNSRRAIALSSRRQLQSSRGPQAPSSAPVNQPSPNVQPSRPTSSGQEGFTAGPPRPASSPVPVNQPSPNVQPSRPTVSGQEPSAFGPSRPASVPQERGDSEFFDKSRKNRKKRKI